MRPVPAVVLPLLWLCACAGAPPPPAAAPAPPAAPAMRETDLFAGCTGLSQPDGEVQYDCPDLGVLVSDHDEEDVRSIFDSALAGIAAARPVRRRHEMATILLGGKPFASLHIVLVPPGASDDAEVSVQIVAVPLADHGTRMLSCMTQGHGTGVRHCQAVLEHLAIKGLPTSVRVLSAPASAPAPDENSL